MSESLKLHAIATSLGKKAIIRPQSTTAKYGRECERREQQN